MCLILMIPNMTLAKKVTCSKGDYSADIEIDKDKVGLGNEAFIAINSISENYEVSYEPLEDGIISISDAGIIKPLKEGLVRINIAVKFDSDNTCTVNMPLEVVDSDATLKNLTLKEFDITPLFKKDKYDYDLNLPYRFEEVTIIATPNSDSAKVTGDGSRYLNVGLNEYEINVTASDGTTATYHIYISRGEANSDTTLKSLQVKGYNITPEFNSSIKKYNLTVKEDVTEINIEGETTDNLATVTGLGKYTLASGENKYTIKVTAEDGSSANYELIVNKDNGSSKLSGLDIKGYDLEPKFSSDIFNYYLTVKSDVQELDIKTKVSSSEQVEITGNENFKEGDNEVLIKVTSEDKSSTVYKILVKKLSSDQKIIFTKNDNLLKGLLVLFVISIVIMITVILIFIKRNYKRKYKLKLKNIKPKKRK